MAAGNILAGFVKGFTGQALDQMERRELAAAEEKKARMLEELRRETAREVALLQESLSDAEVDDKLSEVDYTTGKRILRNSEGKVIGQLAIPESDMEAYRLEQEAGQIGLQDARLGLDVKRANIDQSKAAASYSRAAARRALDSTSGKDEPKMLVAEYERTMSELQEAGATPSLLANFQREFHEGVTTKGWGKSAQRAFLNKMRSTFTEEWEDEEGNKSDSILTLRQRELDRKAAADARLKKKLAGGKVTP